LSARITNRQYLTEIVISRVQTISERMPSALSGREFAARGLHDRLQRIQRARAEIAEHDAERAAQPVVLGSAGDA
jgi:hypothetical protein